MNEEQYIFSSKAKRNILITFVAGLVLTAIGPLIMINFPLQQVCFALLYTIVPNLMKRLPG